jgi:NADPH-dependent glutamate synthase beta subunit-like oxidoreductase
VEDWRINVHLDLGANSEAAQGAIANGQCYGSNLGVAFDPRGNVAADELSYKTSIPKVFACGDMRRGQSLIVWAIREGRQAAHAVDSFLMGSSVLPR